MKKIIEEQGVDILNDKEKLLSCLEKYMHNDKKKMNVVKVALDFGIGENFHMMYSKSDDSEIKRMTEAAKEKLVKACMPEDAADIACSVMLELIGKDKRMVKKTKPVDDIQSHNEEKKNIYIAEYNQEKLNKSSQKKRKNISGRLNKKLFIMMSGIAIVLIVISIAGYTKTQSNHKQATYTAQELQEIFTSVDLLIGQKEYEKAAIELAELMGDKKNTDICNEVYYYISGKSQDVRLILLWELGEQEKVIKEWQKIDTDELSQKTLDEIDAYVIEKVSGTWQGNMGGTLTINSDGTSSYNGNSNSSGDGEWFIDEYMNMVLSYNYMSHIYQISMCNDCITEVKLLRTDKMSRFDEEFVKTAEKY